MEGLKFNFRKLTTRQMHSFLQSVKDNDFSAMADVFAKTAESVPSEWGMVDHKDPEAWKDLNYFEQFRPAITEFVTQGADTTKK